MKKLALVFALLSSSTSNAAEIDFDVISGKMYAAYMNAGMR